MEMLLANSGAEEGVAIGRRVVIGGGRFRGSPLFPRVGPSLLIVIERGAGRVMARSSDGAPSPRGSIIERLVG